jgi:hypothetical protein
MHEKLHGLFLTIIGDIARIRVEFSDFAPGQHAATRLKLARGVKTLFVILPIPVPAV